MKLSPQLDPQLLAGSADVTELRVQNNAIRRYALSGGHVVQNVRSDQSGVSARVFQDGLCGFAASPDSSPEGIRRILKRAQDGARRFAAAVGEKKPAWSAVPAYTRELREVWQDVPQSAYAELCKKADEYIVRHCPQLRDRQVIAYSDTMEKHILMSSGTLAHFASPRSYLYIDLIADSDQGDTVDLFKAIGGFGDVGQALSDWDAITAHIDLMYQRVLDKAHGVGSKAGLHTVILSGELAGMLAHEAVGHTVEADLVLGGSVAADLLGQRVAAEGVSLVDFAHTAFGKPCPLPVYVDDEGVAAEDALLIDNGILKGYMHSRASADRFGVRPQGNARAWLYSDEPLIRMRNTAILPGHDKLAEMIADTEDGYYLLDTNNGQADTTGEFMFGICMGYEIRNGKLGKAIRDTTISGIAFQMLQSVDRIGDTVEWVSSGFCGKKQPMTVGLGGPALRCQITMGGEA